MEWLKTFWITNWQWLIATLLVPAIGAIWAIHKHRSEKKEKAKQPQIQSPVQQNIHAPVGQVAQQIVQAPVQQAIQQNAQSILNTTIVQQSQRSDMFTIHPDQPNESYNWAEVLDEQHKYAEAAKLYEQSAEEYKQVHGPMHLDRARAINLAYQQKERREGFFSTLISHIRRNEKRKNK